MDPALVLPLGFVFAALAYGFSALSGLEWLFPLACLGAAVDLAVSRRPFAASPSPPLRGALLPIAGLVVLFSLTEYRQNRVGTGGVFLVDRVDPEDQAFHASLAFELSHAYPPQVPGLSGFALDYHIGWPLVRAAAVRWGGLSPYDLMSRFDLTVMAIALVLALRSATAALGGSRLAVTLVPWTLVLCTYSWVWARDGVEWWFTLFPGELLPHLFHANSVVPALAIALGAVVCAGRAAEGDRRHAILCAVLAAALPFFKVFLALQVLAGAAVAALLGRRRAGRLALLLPLALATGWLVLSGSGGARVAVGFDLFGPAWQTRRALGLGAAGGGALAGWALLWVVLSLGPRLFAFGAIAAAIRSRSLAAVVLATVAASGWPLSLLFHIRTAEPYSRATQANDALYFMDQSGPLLWLFLVLAVTGWRFRAARFAGLAAASLGFISTAQFVVHKAGLEPARMPAGVVRAMAVLRLEATPGDVVLQSADPKRYPPPPLVLAPLRVPYTRFIPYLTQFAPRETLDRRLDLVRRFFVTTSAAEAREIARVLGARFFCLYGSETVAFETGAAFEEIYSEENVRVYELRP